MATRIIAAALGLAMLALVAVFAWGGSRGPAPAEQGLAGNGPAATLSEQLSEGLIEAQVHLSGGLDYRIDIQFSPDPTSTIPFSLRPEVNFSMADMHMDGFDPPLELVGAGVWRTQGKMPMAGRWIMSVGYGEEFAELSFRVD